MTKRTERQKRREFPKEIETNIDPRPLNLVDLLQFLPLKKLPYLILSLAFVYGGLKIVMPIKELDNDDTITKDYGDLISWSLSASEVTGREYLGLQEKFPDFFRMITQPDAFNSGDQTWIELPLELEGEFSYLKIIAEIRLGRDGQEKNVVFFLPVEGSRYNSNPNDLALYDKNGNKHVFNVFSWRQYHDHTQPDPNQVRIFLNAIKPLRENQTNLFLEIVYEDLLDIEYYPGALAPGTVDEYLNLPPNYDFVTDQQLPRTDAFLEDGAATTIPSITTVGATPHHLFDLIANVKQQNYQSNDQLVMYQHGVSFDPNSPQRNSVISPEKVNMTGEIKILDHQIELPAPEFSYGVLSYQISLFEGEPIVVTALISDELVRILVTGNQLNGITSVLNPDSLQSQRLVISSEAAGIDPANIAGIDIIQLGFRGTLQGDVQLMAQELTDPADDDLIYNQVRERLFLDLLLAHNAEFADLVAAFNQLIQSTAEE